jgi:hypothetical protein
MNTQVYMQDPFGAEKVVRAEPEKVERVGFHRSNRQQSAQAFRAHDTK